MVNFRSARIRKLAAENNVSLSTISLPLINMEIIKIVSEIVKHAAEVAALANRSRISVKDLEFVRK